MTELQLLLLYIEQQSEVGLGARWMTFVGSYPVEYLATGGY